MTFAAVIRKAGSPPSQVPPFAADDDASALAIIATVAARAGASVVMAWEARDGMTRRVA